MDASEYTEIRMLDKNHPGWKITLPRGRSFEQCQTNTVDTKKRPIE